MPDSKSAKEEPRIGVFICHCGSNIAGVIDVERCTEFASNLPGVTYAERNMYTCSEDGLQHIKKAIKEHNLNRVVVAACTPRTHQPLFQDACEQVGVNRYLFEFVNIRDQCSWIHMKEKEKATEKAKRLIQMGVAKASLLEPQVETESPVIPVCTVIGGGIAGVTAALNLANQGLTVHLVEAKDKLGGVLSEINTLFPQLVAPNALLENRVKELNEHKNITVHLNSQVKRVDGYIGNFDLFIDEEGKEDKISSGTIIVAIGAIPFEPQGMYGFGTMENVITQMDLERIMKSNTPNAKNVVMIQCVGARIPTRPYCSRICCMTAIKNALQIKKNNPDTKVHILHRDIMAPGKEYEALYRKAMEEGVRFFRYTLNSPPEIVGEKKAEKIKVYHETLGRYMELETDLIVLSTPLVPREENRILSKMLKVPLGSNGFFLEAHVKLRPVEFATEGIYICGSAKWPSSHEEAIYQAYAAAAKAAIPMHKGVITAEAITAQVNEEECIGCGNCIASCPYTAIDFIEVDGRQKAKVNDAKCKGCGTCIASCYNGAIQQRGFTDRQLLDMMDTLAKAYGGA